jgi:hypothetical protein
MRAATPETPESKTKRTLAFDATLFVLSTLPIFYTAWAYSGSAKHTHDLMPIVLVLFLGVFIPCIFAMTMLILPYGKLARQSLVGRILFFAAGGFQMMLAIGFSQVLGRP